ncbi:MAG: Flp pilus assembly complex ATPase component TadA [Candidatus Omnitrophica bacterium]|nr:Flp pilus assembly complex ATPase component TadA [Candidatus Omnitrophota bacterium]
MTEPLKKRILSALKEDGLINEKRFAEMSKDMGKKNESDIIKLFSESNIVPEKSFLTILSRELDIVPIDLSRVTFDENIMKLVPEKLIRRYSILPLSKIGHDLTLVVSDPTDILAFDDIKTVTGCDLRLVVASRRQVQDAIQTYFKSEEEDILCVMDEDEEAAKLEIVKNIEKTDNMEITQESKAAPIIKMVDLLLSEAIRQRVSDIHIEPEEKSLRVRYRVDGKLHDAFDLPKKNQKAIVTRLKIMSNLDITETRIPQDGRFRVKSKKKEIDFRVSSLPTVFGNKMVLRALDKSNLSVGLETLGFLGEPLADFKEALAKPFGIILVTGPTGSGKSTTLYSVLNKMNVIEKNIVTVEDPVEYQLGGITQIAANPEIGLDFAAGLRALLRQSPDIIMVGEIRDFETADIAVKASLTGQMVLSTLHTNDAVGAITRLVNMGVEPFLISSSLVMACAQRLLRKICPNCKVPAEIPSETLKIIKAEHGKLFDTDKFYRGKGCETCKGTGYYGRLGTLETMVIDEKIKAMIISRSSENEIREYLKSKGVRTLRENAMIKFIKGWTTLEEVLRIT